MRGLSGWARAIAEQYSWRQQLSALVTLWLILQAGLIVVWWRPAYLELAAKQTKVRAAQQAWQQRQQHISEWQRLHQAATAMRREMVKIPHILSQKDAVTWVTQQAQRQALVVENAMSHVRHTEEREVRFTVAGRYVNIGRFINVLTRYGRNLDLLELTWQAQRSSATTLRLSGRVRVVRWPVGRDE